MNKYQPSTTSGTRTTYPVDHLLLSAENEWESDWREIARQVAHEIKGPLTPMKLNIQYLQRALKARRLDAVQLAERLSASIVEQIDNISYIASEFSSFAMMPAPRAEYIQLQELLNSTQALYETMEDVSVIYCMCDTSITVLADRSHLLRVWNNLFQNAIQSIGHRPGVIKVMLTVEHNNALVKIRDNGTGISNDDGSLIFQPYFTTKSSGTGLGLAMTRKIVEFWKGEIWFESSPGEGTTFFVRLPLYHL